MSDKDNLTGSQQDGGDFPVTRWTLVCQSQDATVSSAHQAISKLCEIYWYPLYVFLRRSGCDPHDAEDVTQGFFGDLLAKNFLGAADAEKGRLRSYLMVAIKNYLSNWRRHARAEKRGGGAIPLSIDRDRAEEHYHLEPAHNVTPEILYDR